jgi:hypothetical protein
MMIAFRKHDAADLLLSLGERVMRKCVIALFLVSASVTPAFANYFANPQIGISRNVGSTANPTPQQVLDNERPVPMGQQTSVSFAEFVLRAFGLSVTQPREPAAREQPAMAAEQ